MPAASEEEPLLGAQESNRSIFANLRKGTAPVAQIGVVLLVGYVFLGLRHVGWMLFTAHPALNLIGIVALVQAVLVLQPTRSRSEKTRGTTLHAAFHAFAFVAFAVSFASIEANKGSSDFSGNGPHFKSAHAILGFFTYCYMVVVVLVGVTQYYTPAVYGGVENAKAIWKYHRVCGYLLLGLVFSTVILASETDFNVNTIHIPLWALTFSSVLVLLGLMPGLSVSKLGLSET